MMIGNFSSRAWRREGDGDIITRVALVPSDGVSKCPHAPYDSDLRTVLWGLDQAGSDSDAEGAFEG